MSKRPDTPQGHRFPSEIISHLVWLYCERIRVAWRDWADAEPYLDTPLGDHRLGAFNIAMPHRQMPARSNYTTFKIDEISRNSCGRAANNRKLSALWVKNPPLVYSHGRGYIWRGLGV